MSAAGSCDSGTRFGVIAVRTASAKPESSVAILVVRDGLLVKLSAMVGEGEMEGVTPIPGR